MLGTQNGCHKGKLAVLCFSPPHKLSSRSLYTNGHHIFIFVHCNIISWFDVLLITKL